MQRLRWFGQQHGWWCVGRGTAPSRRMHAFRRFRLRAFVPHRPSQRSACNVARFRCSLAAASYSTLQGAALPTVPSYAATSGGSEAEAERIAIAAGFRRRTGAADVRLYNTDSCTSAGAEAGRSRGCDMSTAAAYEVDSEATAESSPTLGMSGCCTRLHRQASRRGYSGYRYRGYAKLSSAQLGSAGGSNCTALPAAVLCKL
jgi:hypothetical protein